MQLHFESFDFLDLIWKSRKFQNFESCMHRLLAPRETWLHLGVCRFRSKFLNLYFLCFKKTEPFWKRVAMFAMCLFKCSVVLTNFILHLHIKTWVQSRDVNYWQQSTLNNVYLSRSLNHTICNFRYRHRDQDAKLKIKKVYFFWICPDSNAFEWFSDLLQSLEQQVRTKCMLLPFAMCVCVCVCMCVCVFLFVCAVSPSCTFLQIYFCICVYTWSVHTCFKLRMKMQEWAPWTLFLIVTTFEGIVYVGHRMSIRFSI